MYCYVYDTYIMYVAQRNCHLNGSWDALINVTECQSADLDMLNERIKDLLNSTVVNATDLSMISRDLSIITNTSGITAITPEDLNTTNSILSSLIRLAQSIVYIHIRLVIQNILSLFLNHVVL